MTIKYYSSLEEKELLKNEANKRRESTIHDDFVDIDGNHTDKTKGRLIFGIIPNIIDKSFTRKKELTKKLKNDSITFNEFKELQRLERNL